MIFEKKTRPQQTEDVGKIRSKILKNKSLPLFRNVKMFFNKSLKNELKLCCILCFGML